MRSTHFRKFWYGFSTAAALALLIAAVVLSTRLLPRQSETPPATRSGAATPAIPSTPLPFSAQAAQELVLQRLPGSTVTHVELGISRGSLVYEVYLDTGDCYTVDAATGQIAQAATGSKPAVAPQPGPAPINALRAAELAAAKYPGSEVKRVELGTRNGALVYLVELDNGQTVSITAADILASGEPAATSVSAPDDADEADEAGDNHGSDSQDGGRDDNNDATTRPPDDQSDDSNRGQGGSADSTSTPSPSSGPGGSDDGSGSGSSGGSDDGSNSGSGDSGGSGGSDDEPGDGSGGGSGGSDDRPDDGSGGGSGGGSDDRPDDGSGGGSSGSSDDGSNSGSGGGGKDEDGRTDKED